MDRTEFLQMCQQCAVLPNGIGGTKKNLPDDLKVVFDGITYFPVKYTLWFDRKGKPMHTAVLHDLKANSQREVHLEFIEKYIKQEEWKDGRA